MAVGRNLEGLSVINDKGRSSTDILVKVIAFEVIALCVVVDDVGFSSFLQLPPAPKDTSRSSYIIITDFGIMVWGGRSH